MPAFNEAARLPRLLDELTTSSAETVRCCGFELEEAVIVDDGSTDSTPAILQRAGESDGRIIPVLDSGHRGKGGAVAAGLRVAQGDYSLLTDIDLSTPLEDLAQLARAVKGGADIAIGSRELEGSRVVAPRRRRQGGRVFNSFVRMTTKLDLRDTQCGFKLMRTSVGRDLTKEQLCEGFAFDVELLLRARARELGVAEIPVTYLHDPHSRVRMVTASPRMLLDVARLALRARRRGLVPQGAAQRSAAF
jgi:glycosyltransferase involved in cell wall biosynthesis